MYRNRNFWSVSVEEWLDDFATMHRGVSFELRCTCTDPSGLAIVRDSTKVFGWREALRLRQPRDLFEQLLARVKELAVELASAGKRSNQQSPGNQTEDVCISLST